VEDLASASIGHHLSARPAEPRPGFMALPERRQGMPCSTLPGPHRVGGRYCRGAPHRATTAAAKGTNASSTNEGRRSRRLALLATTSDTAVVSSSTARARHVPLAPQLLSPMDRHRTHRRPCPRSFNAARRSMECNQHS
jgi:hypothetical protein